MYYFENINHVNIINRIPQRYFFPSHTEMETTFNTVDEHILHVLRYYHDTLISNIRAIEYLQLRQIFNLEVMKHFSLGFADRSLGKTLKKLSYAQEEQIRGSLQCSGLIKPSGHEFFHGAILFPFVDETGRITGGYGRRITPKLRRGSVYHLHWLSEETTFFNLPVLLKYNNIILCKNPIDALSLYCVGCPSVIALMSIRYFNELHIEKLLQHNIDAVILACEKSTYTNKVRIKLKQAGFEVRFLKLPKGLDVNQCLISADTRKALMQALGSIHTQLHLCEKSDESTYH